MARAALINEKNEDKESWRIHITFIKFISKNYNKDTEIYKTEATDSDTLARTAPINEKNEDKENW